MVSSGGIEVSSDRNSDDAYTVYTLGPWVPALVSSDTRCIGSDTPALALMSAKESSMAL